MIRRALYALSWGCLLSFLVAGGAYMGAGYGDLHGNPADSIFLETIKYGMTFFLVVTPFLYLVAKREHKYFICQHCRKAFYSPTLSCDECRSPTVLISDYYKSRVVSVTSSRRETPRRRKSVRVLRY